MRDRKDTRAIEPGWTAPLVSVLKAIAHPLRLRIVVQLCGGEQHVSALAKRLGASPVIVSQQLRILRGIGVVAATRTHRHVVYRVEGATLRDLVIFAERCATPVHGPARSPLRAPNGARRHAVPLRRADETAVA
jgi:ArsR family transcriptional regulator